MRAYLQMLEWLGAIVAPGLGGQKARIKSLALRKDRLLTAYREVLRLKQVVCYRSAFGCWEVEIEGSYW